MIMKGLLWFDDDLTRTVADKVARAVARYLQKYGHNPDVCYVHLQAMRERELTVGAVKVMPAQMVLPNHFWLGVADSRRGGK
jgi:hypothetical protein